MAETNARDTVALLTALYHKDMPTADAIIKGADDLYGLAASLGFAALLMARTTAEAVGQIQHKPADVEEVLQGLALSVADYYLREGEA